VYNIQNHWIPGLCPSSGILNTRKHNVSETESVQLLRLALSKVPNRVGVSLPHLKTEADPVSETLFSRYFEFWTMNKAHNPSDCDCLVSCVTVMPKYFNSSTIWT
jgi:hypothetical protein